jgi:hypothetical protein
MQKAITADSNTTLKGVIKMKLGTFLKVHAVIALVFGLSFIVMPATVLSYYTTVEVNDIGAFMSRLYGTALLTFAAVLWFASDTDDSGARRAIVKGFFFTAIIGAVVAIHHQLTGQINALGWSTVAIYGFLAAMYGRFHLSNE